ncbi:hypothetical protein MNBD_ACTINO02-2087 [hydrothermal vent metagenome]|uniref:Uncharacterized protein n=1 Tax=hydrothermal vent metagenome TaxID=652676 RepID=A0A3B0T1E7_9ZZZZ
MHTVHRRSTIRLFAGLSFTLIVAACSGGSTAVAVPDLASGQVGCIVESENNADEVVGPLVIGEPVQMTLPDLTEISLSVGNDRFFYSWDATSQGGFDKEYSDISLTAFKDPIVVYQPGENAPVVDVVRLTCFKG